MHITFSDLPTDTCTMTRPSSPIRVLLVEDDIDLAAGLGAFLESRLVLVDYAYSVRHARELTLEHRFDVLVLDVQLPDGDGVSLCRDLKERGLRSPVLFLTARGALDDKLLGFEAGAADYVVKPFAPAELLARIKALAHHIPSSGGVVVRVGEYTLNPTTALFTGSAGTVALNATAVIVLRRLMEVSPGTVSREELNSLVWGGSPPPSDPLRMHVYELRQALSAVFGEPLIETVRGLGYRFGSGHAR